MPDQAEFGDFVFVQSHLVNEGTPILPISLSSKSTVVGAGADLDFATKRKELID